MGAYLFLLAVKLVALWFALTADEFSLVYWIGCVIYGAGVVLWAGILSDDKFRGSRNAYVNVAIVATQLYAAAVVTMIFTLT